MAVQNYFGGIKIWDDSIFCSKCGRNDEKNFSYVKTTPKGEVWHCNKCKQFKLVTHINSK